MSSSRSTSSSMQVEDSPNLGPTPSSSASCSTSSTLLTPSSSPSSSPSRDPAKHAFSSTLPDDIALPVTPTLSLRRHKSNVAVAVQEYGAEANRALVRLQNIDPLAKSTLPEELNKCIFVGHTATDMDSISSAIACAELFDGVAVRASDINSETRFCLDYWTLSCPPPAEDYIKREVSSDGKSKFVIQDNRNVCLVDHNQISQMNAVVQSVASRIRGIIDHHALQSHTLQCESPIYINIRPWGSACTIITNMFLSDNRPFSRSTAGMLLSGILSDTLNLCSPTTTAMDKLMVAILARLTQISNIDELAHSQFRAKSQDLKVLSAHTIVRGDMKTFSFTNREGIKMTLAFGVVETVDVTALLARKEELLLELRAMKAESKKAAANDSEKKTEVLDLCFLALVDIVKLYSILLLPSEVEHSLAVSAYSGNVDESKRQMDLGKRVSRKKEFIPPIANALASGWTKPATIEKENEVEEDFGELVCECSESGCQMQRRVKSLKEQATAAMSAYKWMEFTHQAKHSRPNSRATSPTPPSPNPHAQFHSHHQHGADCRHTHTHSPSPALLHPNDAHFQPLPADAKVTLSSSPPKP